MKRLSLLFVLVLAASLAGCGGSSGNGGGIPLLLGGSEQDIGSETGGVPRSGAPIGLGSQGSGSVTSGGSPNAGGGGFLDGLFGSGGSPYSQPTGGVGSTGSLGGEVAPKCCVQPCVPQQQYPQSAPKMNEKPQGCWCWSEYADSLGAYPWRQCGVSDPGDKYLCTEIGWVPIRQ